LAGQLVDLPTSCVYRHGARVTPGSARMPDLRFIHPDGTEEGFEAPERQP
jgi:hypothetical protein